MSDKPEEKKSGVIDEFKKFAFKGNVVDLAVGVIIGAAFGNVVKALTDWMIMPFLGLITGGLDFSNFYWTLKEAKPGTYANMDEMVAKGGAVIVRYGAFLNTVITFFLVSLAVFGLVKLMARAMARQKKLDEEAAAKLKAEEEAKVKAAADELAATTKAADELRNAATARLEVVLVEIRDLLKGGAAAVTPKKSEPG
jgi:large conductance mechanosensitive channel